MKSRRRRLHNPSDLAETTGLISTHLQRLVNRLARMSLALESREKLAQASLQKRSKAPTGFFKKKISQQQFDAASQVLSLRLSRLSFKTEQPENLGRNAVGAAKLLAPRIETAHKPEPKVEDMPLLVARIFDRSATPPKADWLLEFRSATLAQARQRLDSLGSGDGTQSVLAYLLASLLPGSDLGAFPQVRLQIAREIAQRLAPSKAIISDLRAACETSHAKNQFGYVFILVQVLAILGDVAFASDRLDYLDGPQMLWASGLLPESFDWTYGQLTPVAWKQKPRGMVLVTCALPSAIQLDIGKKALFTPTAAQGVRTLRAEQHIVDKFVSEYSKSEEALSAVTAKVAESLLKSYVAPFRKSKLSPLLHMIMATAIRADDVMFSSLRQVWALHQAIRIEKPKHLCIYADNANFAVRIAQYAAQAVKGIEINIRLIGTPSLADLDFIDDPIKRPKTVAKVAEDWLDQVAPVSRAKPATRPKGRQSTLFCGRPFDRNYIADINRLLSLASADGPTHLIVTAAARAQNGVLPKLSNVIAPEANTTFWTEPESIVRTMSPTLIPPALRDHGSHVVSRAMSDTSDPQHFLLLHAEPQLRRLFERVVPFMFITARLVKQIVANVAPRTIVCLPGRDWLSRMVIAEAKVNLAASTRSFDLQTVFIGPRSRYKTTACDVQVAIETHSVSLFKKYFKVPEKRILLGGSIRYAGSLSAARKESLPTGKPVVLFTASPILSSCLPVARALVKSFEKDRTTIVKIRPHPSSTLDDIKLLEEALQPLGANGVLDAGSSLASALTSAEIIVTRFSNTGLEAAMLGKPVIAADFSAERPPIPLDKMGVALRAADEQALARLIRDLKSGGPLSRRLERTRAKYFSQNPQLLDENIAARLWASMTQGISNKK